MSIDEWKCTSEYITRRLSRDRGKCDVHHLGPEDLRVLTLEASMIRGLPLADTHHAYSDGPGW